MSELEVLQELASRQEDIYQETGIILLLQLNRNGLMLRTLGNGNGSYELSKLVGWIEILSSTDFKGMMNAYIDSQVAAMQRELPKPNGRASHDEGRPYSCRPDVPVWERGDGVD